MSNSVVMFSSPRQVLRIQPKTPELPDIATVMNTKSRLAYQCQCHRQLASKSGAIGVLNLLLLALIIL